MGKKKDSAAEPRRINVEVAPGNRENLDRYIRAYNHRPDRRTPKLKYTDVINEALDAFLGSRVTVARARAAAAKRGTKTED